MTRYQILKERRSELTKEIGMIDQEVRDIQRNCSHTNKDFEYDRDIVEGRTYKDYTCFDCGYAWSERA